MKMVDRRTNIPNQPPKIAKKKSFNVVSGTLRHTEQHTQSWTNTEHGKVKKYDHKKNGFFFFFKYDC